MMFASTEENGYLKSIDTWKILKTLDTFDTYLKSLETFDTWKACGQFSKIVEFSVYHKFFDDKTCFDTFSSRLVEHNLLYITQLLRIIYSVPQ